MGGGRHSLDFYDVISFDNLLGAWREFRKGKRAKSDVALFELNLEDNLFSLHDDLVAGLWKPEAYQCFYVSDPKLRRIHKASVRDRVFHQAVYRKLYSIFDASFIYNSYSSRNSKGTHRGVSRLESFAKQVTGNWRRRGFVLKCDIRKFFDSVDHAILLSLIKGKITDEKLVGLIGEIIHSFEFSRGKGLPLGNVTSQLFANIYLNELDQFVKHKLRQKYYIRYCDDFVILSHDKNELIHILRYIVRYLEEELKLHLHPNKVSIGKLFQGVDFLGYMVLPHRKVLRTKTKNRMFRLANNDNLASYLGICRHAKAEKIERLLLEKHKRPQV